MNAVSVDSIRYETATKAKGATVRIKSLIKKLLKVLFSVDDDAIFKSKDWPYLWPK